MNDIMMDGRPFSTATSTVLEEAAKRFLKAPEIFMRPQLLLHLNFWHQAQVPEESREFRVPLNSFSDKGVTKITALGLCFRIVAGAGRDARYYQQEIAELFALNQQKVTGFPAPALYAKEKNARSEDYLLRTRCFTNIISRGMAYVDLDTAISILKWKEA